MIEHVDLSCLTLWQPWASGIAEEIKTIETRRPSFKFRPTGLLGIHAGKAWDPFFNDGELQTPEALESFDIELLRDAYQVRGCLIAIAEWESTMTYRDHTVWDYYQDEHRCPSSFYEYGKRGLVLRNIRKIKPIPMRGKQGLWKFSGDVEFLERWK